MRLGSILADINKAEDNEERFMDFFAEPEVEDHLNKVNRKKKDKYIGAGTEAHVRQSTSPHEMDRVKRVSSATTSVSKLFLNYLYKHRATQTNPYFPKVFAKKTGGGVLEHHVEKLLPLDTPKLLGNEELMEAVWDKMFNVPTTFLGDDYNEAWDELIADTIDHIYDTENLAAIKDEQLKEALRILFNIHETATQNGIRMNSDLHPGNMMWRMTGNMPQLVITDQFV